MSSSTSASSAFFVPNFFWRYIEKHDLIRVLTTGLIFGFAVLLVRSYGLENKAFLISLAIACVGFPIHHVLPKQLKLPFFVLVSFTSIIITVGLFNAIWLIGLGSLFIILAHIPLAFYLRVVAQVLLGAVLIVFRADLFPSLVPSAIWPILGSMFIFRLMIYMYDLRQQTTQFGPWRALAYFFMMPNVNFTLLPVIDYKNLFAVYYPQNKQSIEIYQKGVVLLIRGVVHLLLYRFIYQNVLVDPATIADASNAAQYLVGTFLLYLRISGYFHMISGILHMYGFNLPETHHLYFLASSFTDFWRRINIFWKDFMQKVFFYPIHFWLSRRTGPLTAVTLGTVFTFFITWFLHAYQWFWIRGDFKLSLQDALFWGSLGVVVLINMIVEIKFPKKRSLKGPVRTWKSELTLAVKTILTFTSIVFIWNVWSTPDFSEFADILAAFANFGLKDFIVIAGFYCCLGIFAVMYGHKNRGDSSLFSWANKKKRDQQSDFWPVVIKTGVGALVLLYVSYYPSTVPGSPSVVSVVTRLTTHELNERDRKLLQRGYYEDLTDVARFNPELQALYKNKPADWTKNDVIVQVGKEFPPYKLLPSVSGEFMRKTVTTNEWGIRDKSYSLDKPENTYRVAIAGASHTFGNGVDNHEVYETIVEERVNKELLNQGVSARFELLNLSLGGFGPACKITLLENKGLSLDLDGMLYVAIDDFHWAPIEIALALTDNNESFPFDALRELAARAGINEETSRTEAEIRLKKHLPEIMEWYYTYLRDMAAEEGVELWFAFIPVPENQSKVKEKIELQMSIAGSLGIHVIDIRDAYSNIDDLSELWVAAWDKHPTAEGHQLLAKRVYDEYYPLLVDSIKLKINK